ncbi:Pex19 protein [Phascolomyces articulosus]|uniref:Pex19 protein n=1 Tax=Phascolomyces articulosus TaxID=60185 RepID=A0AAD5K888_9FUNG|nr:Pex19 protein [Phascolomyces articulosus]
MSAPAEKKPAQQDADSDLDDLLDDVLDDFNTLSTSEKKGASEKTEGKKPQEEPTESSASLDDMFDEDEFAKQLAANMQELMGQMDQDKEMKETFEKIWSSFEATENEEKGESTTTASRSVPEVATTAAGAGSNNKPGSGQPSFQETIAQTMNKLKDSSKQVDSSIAEEGVPDDAFMAEMMRQMESLAENGEFENVLEGMMQQLMSKELLYEPMKDMASKYPDWLKENKDKLSQAEYEKYEKQHELCKQVVAKYDASNFDEKNEAQSREIMDLMQKMQDLGQPPASMLEELAGPGGLNLGPGGIPEDLKDLENCNIM